MTYSIDTIHPRVAALLMMRAYAPQSVFLDEVTRLSKLGTGHVQAMADLAGILTAMSPVLDGIWVKRAA
jgi:hypothetical protein